MEKNVPLRFEVFSSEENDQHRISQRKEIEYILEQIIKHNSRVVLYYGDANEFILTTLLGFDDTSVWLEQGQSNQINLRVSSSEKLICVSSHLNVKVQFEVFASSSEVHDGHPAFRLPFPPSIYRLQRREYYRLATPVENPLRCVVSIGHPPKITPVEVTIMDISGGGVGLTCTESDTELVPGNIYPHCAIELPDFGSLSAPIEVKNLVRITAADGKETLRAGCEFKGLDGASQMQLQRYVSAMQRLAKS
jgi:c-di-GMP-binding flagellar brake protein YcgR